MRKEEKMKKILAYCDKTLCGNCKLKGKKWDGGFAFALLDCLNFTTATERDIDKALNLIG